MFSKTYGLVYRKGKWHVKNYDRVLKKGGYFWFGAVSSAWNRNRTGATPIIELKKMVPRPGPVEDYEPETLGPPLEPGFKPGDKVLAVSVKTAEVILIDPLQDPFGPNARA